MKKTLIGASLLAVFLLMMLPTVAAEEAKVAQSTVRSPTLLSLQTAELEAMKEKYTDGPQPQFILLTLAILFLKLIRMGIIVIGGLILIVVLRLLGNQNNTTSLAC